MKKVKSPGRLLSIIIALTCVNLILLIFAWPTIKQTFPYLFSKNQADTIQKQPALVVTDIVKNAQINKRRSFSGTLRALNSVSLTSEIDGKVEKIFFEEGREVKKGDVLIQIDDRRARAGVNEASALVKQRKAQYGRMKILTEKNYNSVASTEKALAELKTAEAELEKANLILENTKIRAPFDGSIGLRSVAGRSSGHSSSEHNISVGTFISLHQEVATIVALDPLEVSFSVPEQEVSGLSVGQEIDVTVEGFSELPLTAKIVAIEPYSDPVSHGIRVKASIDNKDKELKPGMFARTDVTIANDGDSVVIQEKAIIPEGEQKYVFIVIEGQARQQSVIIGARENGMAQVISGLKTGDVYIVDGGGLLVDGYPVRIKKDAAKQPGPLTSSEKATPAEKQTKESTNKK